MYEPDKERLEKLITDFKNLVNGGVSRIGDKDVPEVTEIFQRIHPTLQASMVRMMITFLVSLKDIRTDGRNQHAVQQINRMIKGFGIVITEEEAERWKLDGYSPEEIEKKKANFLESFNNNPFIYMGVAFI